MPQYYKKIIVNAIQYKGDIQEVIEFTGVEFKKHEVYSTLISVTGNIQIEYGDFIVKNENSEFEVHKPHHFESKYIAIK